MVKNHVLTRSLFVKFFVLKNYPQYLCKVAQIRAKQCYLIETFIFWTYFEIVESVEKLSKTMVYPLYFWVKCFDLKNYLQFYCKVVQIKEKLCYSIQTFIFGVYFESFKLVEKSSKTMV